jgi:nucleotide-binding universal stress UspA family protein/quercetin dioxygenase-like cupin family protein
VPDEQESTMSVYRTILHPTDFSENSRYAFEAACALARGADATLVVLHVMMPSVSPVQDTPPPDPLRPVEAQDLSARLPWPRPADPRVHVEHRLAEGDAGPEILRLAAAARADVVVMGTHGRTGLSRLLMGSVAELVMREATCPVLIVKAPPQAPSAAVSAAGVGEVVAIRPAGAATASAGVRTLLHTAAFNVLRLVVGPGEETPRRRAGGETLVQCLDGRVTLSALGRSQALPAGALVVVPADEPYALRGDEPSTVLLAVLAPRG